MSFTDDFARGNGTLATGNWAQGQGESESLQINNQRVRPNNLTPGSADRYSATQPADDQYMQIVPVTLAGATTKTFSLRVRDSSSQTTFYGSSVDSNVNTVIFYKFVNASFFSMGSDVSHTPVAGHTYRLEVTGSIAGGNIQTKVYDNGSLLGSSSIDSSIDSGYTGLGANMNNAGTLGDLELDTFEGGDLLPVLEQQHFRFRNDDGRLIAP